MKTAENTIQNELLANLRLGKKQEFKNMTLIPLFFNPTEKTHYLTLEEALRLDLIEIFEKNQGGSVPELRVINKSDKRVLIVDAEELSGAKQNRIMNTSILLKKRSETIIPVSCTESGRWNYTSNKFRDSGNIAMPEMRRKKAASVSYSLNAINSYHSDQSEVWDTVDDFFIEAKMESRTRSMKEVYDQKKADVVDYMEAFKIKDHQQGFIVMIDNMVIGMDYFSYTEAFKILYSKVLRSYTIEVHLLAAKMTTNVSPGSPEEFLDRIKVAKSTVFKSPGHGYDCRISGNDLTGNSLVYRNEVIHFAAFDHKADELKRRGFYR